MNQASKDPKGSKGAPRKEPAQQQTQPGYTYENPNEDQQYQPPAQDGGQVGGQVGGQDGGAEQRSDKDEQANR
jgi:hypothetical protein